MNQSIHQFGLLIATVVVRILAMLVVFKYLSVEYGATGFGKLSQIMAIAALFSTFAGGGLSNGLVREVAAAKDKATRISWLQAALMISVFSILILFCLALMLYFFATTAILPDEKIAWVFLLVGLAQIATGLGNTALAYFSGLNAVNFFSLANIIGSLFSIILVLCASHQFGFTGAVASSALFALWPSVFALIFIFFKFPQELKFLGQQMVDWKKVETLATYSATMLVTVAAVPVVLVQIRSQIGNSLGWEAVGNWQSVARIGDAYIQVFGVLLSNFLLPRLSTVRGVGVQSELRWFVFSTLSIFVFGALVFYLFAQNILVLAYSEHFRSASIFVLPQLLADLLKICASFFVFYFLALGRPVIQAAGEVVQAIVMLLSFNLLLPNLMGASAVWAYAAGSLAVLVFVAGSAFLNYVSSPDRNRNHG